jgi:hypothetical protein
MPKTQPVPGPVGTGPVVANKPVPIQTFGGDILIPAGSDVTIDATASFSDRCTGALLLSASGPGVQVSINGSALRTVVNDQAINDAAIQTIRVITAVGSSIIVQLHGI